MVNLVQRAGGNEDGFGLAAVGARLLAWSIGVQAGISVSVEAVRIVLLHTKSGESRMGDLLGSTLWNVLHVVGLINWIGLGVLSVVQFSRS